MKGDDVELGGKAPTAPSWSRSSKVAPLTISAGGSTEVFVQSDSGNVLRMKGSINSLHGSELSARLVAGTKVRCKRCTMSVRATVVILVVCCVFASAVPQLVAWTVTSNHTTQVSAVNLLRSVSNASLMEFERLTGDAVSLTLAIANAAARTPSTCQPGGILALWPELLDMGVITPRQHWYLALGDLWGNHAGVYGAAPPPSYEFEEPVAFLQDTNQYNGSYISFYAKNSTGTWTLGEYAGQESSTYDSRKRLWYTSATEHPNEVRWGDIFLSIPENFQGIAASHTWSPLGSANPEAHYCGVALVMMEVTSIAKYLHENRRRNTDIWIVSKDEAQNIISTSRSCELAIITPNETLRMPMETSEDKLTRQVGKATRSFRNHGEIGDTKKIKLQGEMYYIYTEDVQLYPGTGFPEVGVYVVVPVKEYFASVQRSLYVTISVAAALLLLSAVISFCVSLAISRPLRVIVNNMERIAALENTAPSKKNVKSFLSEIISLRTSMKKMNVMLDSFQKYVPIQVLRLLLKRGEIAKLHVSRRECAVLFCDIENFTPLTANTADPAVLLQVFTEFMDICTKSIDDNKGLVDKLIGDCVMAFWGYPGEEVDQALNACKAALDIQRRLEEARARWQQLHLPLLNCRIGISFGEVLVGNSGSSNHFHYTVLGSPVNLAARLEPVNKVFHTHVLICPATHSVVSGVMLSRHVATCLIKGFSEPQDVYELVADFETAPRELVSSVALYNDAMHAARYNNTDTAIDKLQQYLQTHSDDAFARYQVACLQSGESFSMYTEEHHKATAAANSVVQQVSSHSDADAVDYILDLRGGV